MKKAYICSRYKGKDKEEERKHIKKAQEYSQYAYAKGYLPICVHIYLNEATGLSEENGHREKLLKLGIEMLLLADECWVFTKQGISQGMLREIDSARENKIKIREFNI